MIEEASRKQLRQESVSTQETIISLHKKENKLIDDLMEQQRREVTFLLQQHSEELQEIYNRNKQEISFKLELEQQQKQQEEEEFRTKKEKEIRLRITSETVEIIKKLRKESEAVGRTKKVEAEQKLDLLRTQLESNIEKLRSEQVRLIPNAVFIVLL